VASGTTRHSRCSPTCMSLAHRIIRLLHAASESSMLRTTGRELLLKGKYTYQRRTSITPVRRVTIRANCIAPYRGPLRSDLISWMAYVDLISLGFSQPHMSLSNHTMKKAPHIGESRSTAPERSRSAAPGREEANRMGSALTPPVSSRTRRVAGDLLCRRR
jgi:hypothetical protein